MPKNIFLTDDDADDCMLFSEVVNEIYKPDQFRLTITHDGAALMKQLQKTDALPDVIFLDLNMPRKNGFECLAEIRQNQGFDAIAVIIFSTSSNKDIIERTHKGGANYYICKPQSYAQLKKTITYVLSLDDATLKSRASREQFVITVS